MTGREPCVSLHEPWASLLCYGVKRIEGREWRTRHRGRIWIHSTAKKLPQGDTEAVVFPAAYHHSAVLGTVDVVDCLTVCTRYAWLCERPRVLAKPVRMRGSRGIWYLDLAQVAGLELVEPPMAVQGGAPFSWAAFPRPAGLLTAKLPPSKRASLWVARYGSPASACWRPPADAPKRKAADDSAAEAGKPGERANAKGVGASQRAITAFFPASPRSATCAKAEPGGPGARARHPLAGEDAAAPPGAAAEGSRPGSDTGAMPPAPAPPRSWADAAAGSGSRPEAAPPAAPTGMLPSGSAPTRRRTGRF